MAITINEYCAVDNYRRTEDCGLTDSGVSFSMSNVNIASTTYGQYANISFYVNNPRNQGFLSALTLASILVMRETNFELLLEQQITIQTSFAPMNPPTASDDQIINSIIIEITFNLNQWNFLIDRRLRSAAIAPRVSAYCRLNSVTCDLRNRASTFSVDNVQRTSAATPSAAMSTNQIYYRFYVKYPQTNTSIPQNILATIVTAEELVVESLSRLSFSLQTPPDTVQIRVFNLQINQFDTSLFRTNLARAAEEFCGVRESLCNFSSSSAIVSSAINISPDNVTILPRSPSTIGDGLLLSFTLQKPDGSALSPVILRTAIRTSRTQVISQNNSIITPPFVNPPLSDDQRLNLVRLNINASDTSIDREAFRLDVQYSIALRMNEFCRNNTNSSLCSSNQFTINDVIVQIETNGSVSFAVLLPSTNTPLNSNEVQSVTNGTLMSSIFNVSLNMLNNDNNVMTTMPPDEDDDPDFALILGLSIGGLVLLIFVVVAVVCLKARNSNASKFPVATDGGGSWQFDRDAPYTGSAFAGAERIPGFDDDGLPTEISSGGNDPGTI
ncbi:uncharacterized protein LOC124445699 [Xenia sp. Carnegie-2017]|uniref:uncharacterized protein LOC124445699 n=1 Tax=Xenia sp. Carnegie-2017 TaxID=2897299 RepID=UPI001F0491D0|nr:uncharacterized protein LOC124445699 [Xenia sp. Carnegie-2017]